MVTIKIQLDPQIEYYQLFGSQDENLKLIESQFHTTVVTRGDSLVITGQEKDVQSTQKLLLDLAAMIQKGHAIDQRDVRLAINDAQGVTESLPGEEPGEIIIQVSNKKRPVRCKSMGQKKYVEAIKHYDMVFGIGPAGTGKTYLAMAMAISALLKRIVSRIILARPAVEAGEKLGFLPGDLYAKVHPYLRPLYDALYDMMETDKANRLIERGYIEIAPLAFMRGRTLNDSFVILDEAQNTTSEQMKMFLTRLGFNSKTVITGDITQVDLPVGKISGLIEVRSLLKSITGIKFVYFTEKDVVRHELVQQIIRAYEAKGQSEG
jgi:phosphate starvation-inducible PhoH-like protein